LPRTSRPTTPCTPSLGPSRRTRRSDCLMN
jgi:hypothetical protein